MGKKPVVHSVLMVGGLVVLLTTHSGCGCCGQKQKYTTPSTFQGSIKGSSQQSTPLASTGGTGGANAGKLAGTGDTQWSVPPKGTGAGTTADLAGRSGQVSMDNRGSSPTYNIPGTSTGAGTGGGMPGQQGNSTGPTQDSSLTAPTAPLASSGVQTNQTHFGGATGPGASPSGMDDMPLPPVSSSTGLNHNLPPPPPLGSSRGGQHGKEPSDPQTTEQLLAPPPFKTLAPPPMDPQ